MNKYSDFPIFGSRNQSKTINASTSNKIIKNQNEINNEIKNQYSLLDNSIKHSYPNKLDNNKTEN
jgi:hypothetical protein